MARPISAATLKKLLQIVSFDPSQFDVKETPESRIYTWKGTSSADQQESGWWGSITISFTSTAGSGTGPYWITLHFERGILIRLSYRLDSSTETETDAPYGWAGIHYIVDSRD